TSTTSGTLAQKGGDPPRQQHTPPLLTVTLGSQVPICGNAPHMSKRPLLKLCSKMLFRFCVRHVPDYRTHSRFGPMRFARNSPNPCAKPSIESKFGGDGSANLLCVRHQQAEPRVRWIIGSIRGRP